MQLFWNLSSVRDDDRLVAADGIIKKLSSQEVVKNERDFVYITTRRILVILQLLYGYCYSRGNSVFITVVAISELSQMV